MSNPFIQLRMLALPLLFLACTTGQPGGSLPAGSFAKEVEQGQVQLLDVRTPAEFQNGHIAGAVNMDWTGGQLEASIGTIDKAKPVRLYCAAGRRSAAARDYLHQQGFTDVKDLEGGIQAWEAEGRSVSR